MHSFDLKSFSFEQWRTELVKSTNLQANTLETSRLEIKHAVRQSQYLGGHQILWSAINSPQGKSGPKKKSSGWRSRRLRQFVAILSCIASGARDKSEILVLDITYKNILNENTHATVSMLGSIYLACKILINESPQRVAICKIFNCLRAIRLKGLWVGGL